MGGYNNTIDLIELLATIDCSVGNVNDNKKVKNQNEKLVRKVDDKTNKPTSKIGQTSKTHTACFGDIQKHTLAPIHYCVSQIANTIPRYLRRIFRCCTTKLLLVGGEGRMSIDYIVIFIIPRNASTPLQ